MEGLAVCFEDLEDPRTGNAGRHDLVEIMVIALCTVLCGGQYASDMELFAREKEAFLRQFLKLEKGLPSHTPSLGCSASLIRNSSAPASKSSWASFRKPAKASSP
jgi:DDE_Tnp_1-associated